jgi:hypothetical protein
MKTTHIPVNNVLIWQLFNLQFMLKRSILMSVDSIEFAENSVPCTGKKSQGKRL